MILLRKDISPYEYIYDWEKHYYLKRKIFIVTSIWKILLMQITLTQKEFVKILILKILKSLEEYHDLYVQSDTLLLADVSENFRNEC